MGGENLSQAEVASLSRRSEPVAGQAAGLRLAGMAAAGEQVVRFDAACAERLGPALETALLALHEVAARHFAAALSALLRSAVRVRVAQVEQLTYAQFVQRLAQPTCFSQIRSAALGAQLALDSSPAIVYPIIDRLMGGDFDHPQPVHRPLSQIEQRLAGRITNLLLEALRRAWESVAPMDFDLVNVETNPQAIAIAPPAELVAAVSLEVSVGEVRGLLRLCLPCPAIELLRDKLTSRTTTGELPKLAAESARTLAVNHSGATVEVVVALAHTRIPAAELASLRVGDIITTETDVGTPLVVNVAGVAQFRARPGAYKGRKAICIEDRVAGEPASEAS